MVQELRWRRSPIHIRRTGEIARVFAKHGLDWLAYSHSPLRFVGVAKRWFLRDPQKTQPARLRVALEELGVAYIKAGQTISTRTDLLPKEYIAELSKLQDSVPPLPFDELRRVFVEELGLEPEAVFDEFCTEPQASASIGQVYRARLQDGSKVVVKIQRPGTLEKVEEDLEVLRDLAGFLTKTTNVGKQQDLHAWLDEFEFSLRNELDYRREAHNADLFRDNFKDDPDVYVPRIYWELTTPRVLVMEQIQGFKLADLSKEPSLTLDPGQLARKCARVVLNEIFRDGFFHADPHQGNFFVLSSGAVALIDFGMVGRIDPKTIESLLHVMQAIRRRDAETIVDEIDNLGVSRAPCNRQLLKRDLQKLIETHMEGDPANRSLAQMLNDLLRTASQHSIQLPGNLLLLAKAIAMCEGLATILDPTFNLIDFTEEFLEEKAKAIVGRDLDSERMKESLHDLIGLSLDLPHKVRHLIVQAERGELTVTTRFENMDQMLAQFHVAANRLTMAAILASLIIGMSFVISRSQSLGAISLLLQIMLVLAVLGSLALLISMWRSKKF